MKHIMRTSRWQTVHDALMLQHLETRAQLQQADATKTFTIRDTLRESHHQRGVGSSGTISQDENMYILLLP